MEQEKDKLEQFEGGIETGGQNDFAQNDFELEQSGDVEVHEKIEPQEHIIIADPQIKEIMREALETIDPDGKVALIFAEHIDSSAQRRSDALGLSYIKELAEKSEIVIVAGWMLPSDYANNPIWHAGMAFPNVYFVRLPFAFSEIEAIVEKAKDGESRPFDPLAIRLLDINKSVNEIATLEHIMNRAIETGGGVLKDWEEKARKIFGDEMSLDEIIERVRHKNGESLSGQMVGEEYPDLCVDIEGTLIQKGEINKDLLQKMAEESKTRPITIWTGGNIESYKKILRDAGIAYKLVSKYWMRGAKIAKAIDDMPKESFEQIYGVEVEEYIQI